MAVTEPSLCIVKILWKTAWNVTNDPRATPGFQELEKECIHHATPILRSILRSCSMVLGFENRHAWYLKEKETPIQPHGRAQALFLSSWWRPSDENTANES